MGTVLESAPGWKLTPVFPISRLGGPDWGFPGFGLGYAGWQHVYCKSEVTHSILKPTLLSGLSGLCKFLLFFPHLQEQQTEKEAQTWMMTLIYTLNFLRCKLAPA